MIAVVISSVPTVDSSARLISAVLKPASNTALIASSIFSAKPGSFKEYFNIMLRDKIVAIGLAKFCPAISGAEP